MTTKMAPVIWNPKNNYAMSAGGKIGFTRSYVVLGSGREETFKITNSRNPNERVDMLKPVRIFRNSVVWSKNSANKIITEKNESGGFYWQMEPLIPIEQTDETFKARIRHIRSGLYVAFIEYKTSTGSTYFGHIVNKDKAAEVTVENRSF